MGKQTGTRTLAYGLAASVLLLSLTIVLTISPPVWAADYVSWTDIGIVYTAPSGDAYYPSVIFDPNGFGSGSVLYKMWYTDGGGGVFAVTSTNGINWNAPITASVGLGNDAHHVQVLYNPNCFGASPCDASAAKYKIWYWDIDADLYSIAAMATAQSTDGITWTNDTSLTQSDPPLVTGGGSGWNRGTYGPIHVFYQASASNSGTDPWNYSYVMYYDGTDGSSEVTGLAYSSDGLAWTRYVTSPVLDKSSGAAWDCDDAAYGTIQRDLQGYHFWYSGGGGDNGSGGCQAGDPVHEGIGYASSSDGKTWSKYSGNPIFHISQGVSYRDRRVYTPAVVRDSGTTLKMYYSAQATGSGQPKKIGLATGSAPTAVRLTGFRAGTQEDDLYRLAWFAVSVLGIATLMLLIRRSH